MDLDLRKLRYFVTVADCASFRAAAQQLHVAQPALSRQVRALEADFGVVLLVRSGRGVVLTDEGRRILHEGRSLLHSSAELVGRARRSTAVRRRFTVGFRPGIGVTALARRFQETYPRLVLDLVVTSARDQVDLALDGRVDVSLVRSPWASDGLECVRLFVEPRVVVIAARHPIAALGRVSVHELRWLGLLQSATDVPELSGMAPDPRPGVSPRMGSGTFDVRAVERFERVAAGQGALVVPLSVAAIYQRADLATVTLDGAAPSEVLLVRRNGNDDPVVGDFTRLAIAELQPSRDQEDPLEASV
jgi:DNA-binding transcriptional LysR family regulator